MPTDRKPEPDDQIESGDPFYYGYRWRRVRLPSGEESTVQIPLTPEDLLDPELSDKIFQTVPHFELVTLLAELFLRHFRTQEDVLILGNVKIYWDMPGLPNPSPDLMVIREVHDREKPRRAFYVSEEGVWPCLIIEVVADSNPVVRSIDYERKVEIYEKAGVTEYLIFDQPFTEQDSLRLTGFRLDSRGRYQRIEPDDQGRLMSKTTDLLFEVAEDGLSFMVTDAVSGKPVRTSIQEMQAREAAEARIAQLRVESAERTRADGS